MNHRNMESELAIGSQTVNGQNNCLFFAYCDISNIFTGPAQYYTSHSYCKYWC